MVIIIIITAFSAMRMLKTKKNKYIAVLKIDKFTVTDRSIHIKITVIIAHS